MIKLIQLGIASILVFEACNHQKEQAMEKSGGCPFGVEKGYKNRNFESIHKHF